MTGKRKLSLQGDMQLKKQRKCITIDMKLDIIKRIEKGERISDVGRELGFSESTVRTIRDNAPKIKESIECGTLMSAAKTSYARSSIMEKMERMLSNWIEDQNQRNAVTSMPMVQAKARTIYDDLAKSEENPKMFFASAGWFSNFKKRYKFHNIKMSMETASSEITAAENFIVTLEAIIEEGCYSPKQIFNLDETGLFWKRMPSRTYISQEEESASSFNIANDRFSLLLGGNAQGDCKLKPVMVYHSANPYALKGYVKSLLPVHFYSNDKGWVTGSLFCDYIVSKLQDELRQYCTKNNLDLKILLLLDNAPGHPPSIQDLTDNIKIVFLPPNTTSLIQPMDQGVIATFKVYYLKKIFTTLVKASEDNKMTVKECWKSFTIRDSIMFVGEAWKEVTSQCMNSVWEKMCPYLVHDFEEFSVDEDVAKTQETIVELANKLDFTEVDLDDVVNLLNSHKEELTTEELLQLKRACQEEERTEEIVRTLTSKRLMEAFHLIETGLDILDEDDPNIERSSTVRRKVLEDVQCYAEILKQRKAKVSQSPLPSYFKQEESLSPSDPQPSTSFI